MYARCIDKPLGSEVLFVRQLHSHGPDIGFVVLQLASCYGVLQVSI